MATKRSRDEGQEGSEKKVKLEGKEGGTGEDAVIEIRVLITNYEAGVVIGKGGANVKAIREKSSAFISILKSEGDAKDRVMTVKGTVEHIAQAVFHILSLLLEDKQKKDQEAGSTEPKDETYVLKLLVHKFLAGCIIGKAGTIIKQITADTGARIQVSNEPLPGSAEKSVTLTGTPTATHQAILRVLVQIRENPMRPGSGGALFVPGRPVYGQGAPYGYPPPPGEGLRDEYLGAFNPPYPPPGPSGPEQTQKIAIPTICAGSVIGKGGTIIADIKAQSGCQIRIADPEQTSPNERVVTVTGTPAGIQTAVYLIRQRVEQPYGPPPGGFAGDSAGVGDSSQKIAIPTVCAGAVIGKGGTIINDIKGQSGCQIRIADPDPSTPNERVVTVTGSPQGIQTAVYLIRQRVEQPYAQYGEQPAMD
jgi:polyribonucleotide nucleotidyltransferase